MANVKLSQLEMELVTDAQLILTKNSIIQKVYELFGNLSDHYRNNRLIFPAEVLSTSPKISKGENYQGLPWVMLDYPRLFSKTNVFAIRSFFWWGNFFSITVQLHGIYKEKYVEAIQTALSKQPGNWWYCINDEDNWQHHFESSNYIPVNDSIDLHKLPFIKLAKKIPLQQWDNSFNFYVSSFGEIAQMLSAQPVK